MDEGTSATTGTRAPRRRAWRLLLGILAVGVLSAGGVYLWQWLHRPPELRVVARYDGPAAPTAISGGFALQEVAENTSMVRITYRDWEGRELWRIDDAHEYRGTRTGVTYYSPDGHWCMRTSGYAREPVTLWHDGRKVRTEAVASPRRRGPWLMNDGTAWFVDDVGESLIVTAMGPDRTRVGRVAFPRPVLPGAGRNPCFCSGASLAADGTLEVAATCEYPANAKGIVLWDVYDKYRTYRVHVLPDRLRLEMIGKNTSAARRDSLYIALSGSVVIPPPSPVVQTPSGATWTIPSDDGSLVRRGATADGRYAFALRVARRTERPSALDIIRARWHTLRGLPAPPPTTTGGEDHVVSVYEQPGTRRCTARFPVDPLKGGATHYGSDILVAPDGHAALVSMGQAYHLLRW